MRSWGSEPFDNIVGANWAYSVTAGKDLSLIELAFDRLEASRPDDLEISIAAEAFAACEVVARLKGHGGAVSEFGDLVDSWLAANRLVATIDLTARAKAAINLILRAQSGLRRIQDNAMHDTIDLGAWRAALLDLNARLDR